LAKLCCAVFAAKKLDKGARNVLAARRDLNLAEMLFSPGELSYLFQTWVAGEYKHQAGGVSLMKAKFGLMTFSLALFASVPMAQATCKEGCDLTSRNTFLGDDALSNATGGSENTAVGADALFNDTSGIGNTAVGESTLLSNTSGNDNTAIGTLALFSNTSGTANVACGDYALNSNTVGEDNTAAGHFALFHNTTGSRNAATGATALLENTTGTDDTATGNKALFRNSTGSNNTANGSFALYDNTTGFNNTSSGEQALFANRTGSSNTAAGFDSLLSNTTGNSNTAVGGGALFKNSTGSSNIAVGTGAGINVTTGSNNIEIGNAGLSGEMADIRIGTSGDQTNTYIAGISGVTVAGGIEVIVDSKGHLGTMASSARFKDDIQPMAKASEAILSLRPVTFRYKKELDSLGTPQFGLVAEQVAKVDPDLVALDQSGKPYAVRYEAVNAMLLNEFLKEHRKVEEQIHQAASQNARIESLEARIAKLETMVEKVSAQETAERNGASRVASANE
jgi:hypothetical protein